MEPRKPTIEATLRQLFVKIVAYRFLLMMISFLFIGILLIFGAGAQTHELLRDVGIGLFVAGTVGLGVEFFVRKEMENEFRAGMDESIGELRNLQAGSSEKIDEIRLLLRNNNLRDMGVRQVYPSRGEADFAQWLRNAVPGSTVRLLALCLDPDTVSERLIQQKLREGCRIKLLLLDPHSAPLDQRAREEAPGKEEAFKARVRLWAATHQEFVKNLEPELAGRFELAFYVAAPTCFIADDERSMLVGLYLNQCRGDDCPHLELEIKPGGACEAFRRHFTTLWPDRRKEALEVDKDRRGMRAV